MSTKDQKSAKRKARIGRFSAVTYNVAGLPNWFPSFLNQGKVPENSSQISPLLNAYDIVMVQEDFNYHKPLIRHVEHPYLSRHSGIAGIGSGLNTLSKFPFVDFKRVTWQQRYGIFRHENDRLTPKGFTYAKFEVAPGIYIDIYNLHTDAGGDPGSLTARRSNIAQLSQYIEDHSEGNAVIVLGDTNTRYTRSPDNIRRLIGVNGLTDAWIEHARQGKYPEQGGEALMNDQNKNGADYEVVDKVFYRGSRAIDLRALSYRLEDTRFTDVSGNQLSDHFPIHVEFEYEARSDIQLSHLFGGSGGAGFSHLPHIPDEAKVTHITMCSSRYVNGLSLTYSNESMVASGGVAGEQHVLRLDDDEHIVEVQVCKVKHRKNARISYMKVVTNKGQSIAGGTVTNNATTFAAPGGMHITGFFGRAGDEIDKLGVIYMTRPI